MFIHFGLYAVNGLHEQEQWRYSVPYKKYQENINKFNPSEFSPKDIISLAKDCGSF